MTHTILLPHAALAHHLDRLLAHRFGTVAVLMTRRHTLMSANRTGLNATLSTHLPCRHALSLVARLYTLVLPARQLLVARHSAAETLLAARNSPSLLVVPIAELGRLQHTRRTNSCCVTVVEHGMGTGVTACARLVAGRLLSATRNGRINHLSSTLALQLVEGHPMALQTMSRMTRPLAFMLATAQSRWTGQWTNMIDLDATLHVALVLSATPLLRALLLASSIIRSSGQLFAFHHLVHLATTTLHRRRFLTRRTRSQVALADATMRTRRSATAQDLVTNGLAQGNLIQASLSFRGQNWPLTTRTRFDAIRLQVARATLFRVAQSQALVVLAIQLLLAGTRTGELHRFQVLSSTGHRFRLPATVAIVLQLLVAGITCPGVALLGAPVQAAVTHLIAESVARIRLLLRTNHRLGRRSTTTVSSDRGLARWTGTWMTEQRTRMRAVGLPFTDIPATVRNIRAVVNWIFLLATEAHVVVGDF